MTLRVFNPWGDIRLTHARLPHWQQEGAVYVITFHIGDAIPQPLLQQWEETRAAWLRLHPPPRSPEQEREYHRRFSGEKERWRDAGHGACLLRDPRCAGIVAEALRHFDGARCAQIAWVVMPNHVHALLSQNPEWPLEKLLHRWKSFTTKAIHAELGGEGTLWQRDYFDRLVRDETHLANCVRYIRRNPEKAHLRPGEFILYESDLAKSIE